MDNYKYTLLIDKDEDNYPVTHIIRSTTTTSAVIEARLWEVMEEYPGEWCVDDWFNILPDDCEVINENEFGEVWY